MVSRADNPEIRATLVDLPADPDEPARAHAKQALDARVHDSKSAQH